MDFESKSPQSRARKGCEHYSELCALFTTGGLTEHEQGELNTHVLGCKSCAKLLFKYRALAKSGAALLAPVDQAPAASAQKPWSIENARKQLLNRIEADRAMSRPKISTVLPSTRQWMDCASRFPARLPTEATTAARRAIRYRRPSR